MLLDVKNLNVAYGDASALWDISLHIDVGEIVSVIGPNGAGKSTLVNSIAGLLRPKSGKVLMDGIDIAQVRSHEVCQHNIALVPEGRRLFTNMSVIDNLELGSYRIAQRSAVKTTLDNVFALFPILQERQHQVVGTMSGGQQQMVAISRALMAKPRLLLMDEPSLGLAPKIVDDMFRIIQSIHQQGIAVLLIEQNLTKALSIANRAYVIEDGRIVISGDPRVLQKDPRIREAYLGL
jgi:branched-chain amino acid transport system ATP-binding protein